MELEAQTKPDSKPEIRKIVPANKKSRSSTVNGNSEFLVKKTCRSLRTSNMKTLTLISRFDFFRNTYVDIQRTHPEQLHCNQKTPPEQLLQEIGNIQSDFRIMFEIFRSYLIFFCSNYFALIFLSKFSFLLPMVGSE